MDFSNKIKTVKEIASNKAISIDERIERTFTERNIIYENNKEEISKFDIEFLPVIISMIRDEEGVATHLMPLMQVYTMLAEALVKEGKYKKMKSLAEDVREIMRDKRVSAEVAYATLPRIIDALGKTVYKHLTYDLLLVLLRNIYDHGLLTDNMSGYARHWLKLSILITDYKWGDYLISNDFQNAVANLFSPEELVKIILNPAIGFLKADPVEYTWKWEQIYYEVEEKLEQRFANAPKGMGFCFMYWSTKADILKEEYGIEWKYPSLMNPGVMFD